MTKKRKLRRNSFAGDNNAQEDDFILADLNVMLDEEELSPVQLNHSIDDEAIIDRLLIKTGFDANDEPEEDGRESEPLIVNDMELDDDFSGFDKFVVEPVELAEQNLRIETKEAPTLAIHSMADFDEIPNEDDAIDRLLVNAGFDHNDELELDNEDQNAVLIDNSSCANEVDLTLEEQKVMFANPGIIYSSGTELALDKDATNDFFENEETPGTAKQEEAIIETNYPEKALESLNNATGTITLSAVSSEQVNIKRQIKDYENKIKKAAIITYTSLGLGIVAILSTVVMGIVVSSMQAKVSKLSELVSILEEDMSVVAEKDSDMEINDSDTSNEQLNQKNKGLPEQSEEQQQVSSGILERDMPALLTKQSTIYKSVDNRHNRSPLQEKKTMPEATVKKISAEKKTNNIQRAAGWSVNLTAYDDLGYAKSKAAKFIQKDIPVIVKAVDMNNSTWYRLTVGGFKNKEDATSYAAKIKKLLNLNTVFVGNS